MAPEKRAGSASDPLRAAVYYQISIAQHEDHSSLATQQVACWTVIYGVTE